MSIEQAIDNYLSLVLNSEEPLENLDEFIQSLDALSYWVQLAKYQADETNYDWPPDSDYNDVRKIVEKRFPSFGYYNSVVDVSEKIGESEISIGDAIDDIVDITGDLLAAKWRFEHTSRDDAIFHLVAEFRSHWGRHLRDVQLYIHDLWW